MGRRENLLPGISAQIHGLERFWPCPGGTLFSVNALSSCPIFHSDCFVPSAIASHVIRCREHMRKLVLLYLCNSIFICVSIITVICILNISKLIDFIYIVIAPKCDKIPESNYFQFCVLEPDWYFLLHSNSFLQ